MRSIASDTAPHRTPPTGIAVGSVPIAFGTGPRRVLFETGTSVVLTYAEHVNGVQRRFLEQASIREPAAVLDAGEVRSVRVGLLDMTTDSATGTFKDWLACVTVAHCLEHGIERFVTQTSGNTGNALLKYAIRQGIHVIAFYPAASRYKIDGELARSPLAALIEVHRPEPEIKRLTAEFSCLFGIPWLPLFLHQIEANKLRAYFLADCARNCGIRYDWHVQALSSGYGIFGLYQGLDELATARGLSVAGYPRLLGVQQEAVCPFADYVGGSKWRGTTGAGASPPVIEPTLFRTTLPNDLLDGMAGICRRHGGTVEKLRNERYRRHHDEALSLLRSHGIAVGESESRMGERIMEQAGIVATAGFLEHLARGAFAPANSVLIALTGGVTPPRSPAFAPFATIGWEDPDYRLLAIGQSLGLRLRPHVHIGT